MELAENLLNLFRFPRLGSHAEASKLVWIVRLRWVAIILFFTIAGPGYVVGWLSSSTLLIFIGVISILILFNLFTQLLILGTLKIVSPLLIGYQLAFDLVILTCLLLVSGGFANPLVGLFLINAALGGVLIQGRYSWPFLFLCHALLIGLQIHFFYRYEQNLNSTISIIFMVSHILIFAIWFVMRSLGTFLENYFSSLAQSQVLNEKQDRLRSIGALAAGFSHEFASPLNAAKLRMDRLLRQLQSMDLSSDILENLKEAQRSLFSCENVIHAMNSSQLDVRDHQLRWVPIKDLITDIVDSWKEDHPQVILDLNIQSDQKVKLSPIGLSQVLLNLLDNAYEAESNQAITVRLEIVNQQIFLSVQDRGSGFSSYVLGKRGEPFVTTKKSGTGLGLYVSEIFAQSMGGYMELSNTNPGALVIISWPIREEK